MLSKDKKTKSFNEVFSGFTKRIAQEEARRCPQCSAPTCTMGCPLGIDIPGFIRLLREGDAAGALKLIKEQNDFSGICGRVCSAPCEKACILEEEGTAIRIRDLERYAFDHSRQKSLHRKSSKPAGKKVAVIGSGPAGLAVSARIIPKGYQVTIFESFPLSGGVLRYGIPDFRLPKNILDAVIADLQQSGVQIQTNSPVGKSITLEDILAKGFSAIVLAVGIGGPAFLNIPGTHLGGVHYGEELLLQVNFKAVKNLKKQRIFKKGNRVVVIGAGNTALDCARICIRLGKEVTLAFETTDDELHVHKDDREYAQQEGVKLEGLLKPLELLSDESGWVAGIKCCRMDFADPHSTGQWQLIPVPGSEFVIAADTVIVAVGQKTNARLPELIPNLKIHSSGIPDVHGDTGMTSCQGIFASGVAALGCCSLVEAFASGKKVSGGVEQYLQACTSLRSAQIKDS